MGYVFRAEHVKLGREVALKLLRGDYAKRRDAVARFFQEARTVNRIRHRNIVDVTDLVEIPDGPTFIIMEFLQGVSLGKWARSGIDLPRALAVLVQICDGLGAAHELGVVHRDLKPDNVIVMPTSDGAELAKLLDFGVAKLLNREDEDFGFQTAAGSVIGTPAYMSPEQAGGMVIDARSDIYSLGAIMYELFCGQPMFRGRSFGEYVRKHLTEMPQPPRQTAGGHLMDPRLENVILRSIAKDPNQRFSNIHELREALLGMLGGLETHPPLSMASIATSGVRPAPTYVPPSIQTSPPSAPMGQYSTPTPGLNSVLDQLDHSGQNSHVHQLGQSQLHPSQMLGQSQMHQLGQSQMLAYSQIAPGQAPVATPSTPWWVWFVGGAVAVGLGVGAAVWYAGRDDTPVPTHAAQIEPPKPVITPEPAELPSAPKLIELKFDSLPSGGVYEDGHSAELCRTPCAFNVDPSRDASSTRRRYIIRAPGYKDTSLVVDLSESKRDFSITLEQLPPTTTVTTVTPPDTTTSTFHRRGTKSTKRTNRTSRSSKTSKT